MAATGTPSFRWLLPLWITAALLLSAGWYASAQPDTVGGGVPVPAGTETGAGSTDAQSGIAADPGLSATPPSAPETAGDLARRAQEAARGGSPAEKAVSLLGLVVFVLLAYLMSVNRKAVAWRVVGWGIGLQFLFGAVILLTKGGGKFFDRANRLFTALIGYTNEGAKFLFGNLIASNVPVGPADGPYSAVAATGTWADTGALFAFSVLPTIIFFSSLMTLLYYLGVMQLFVKAFAKLMQRTMGISGAESLSASGNIFLGQTEAPLLVAPYVKTMTKSELHSVMTGGMATVAGGVLAAYVGMLVAYFPSIAGHLIAASVMSAPAAVAISKIMYPETEEPVTRGELKLEVERVDANAIDAAARGAGEGLQLALNVGAMLLAFIALLALLNGLLGWAAGLVGLDLSIQLVLGWLFAPFAWLMGTPWQDAQAIGTLLGEKTALNEFVAYLHLAEMLGSGADLQNRSVVIATYALCGFSNFSSIAIQIGGIGGLAPERRADISRLGLRAMIAGTLASFMTACVVGILM